MPSLKVQGKDRMSSKGTIPWVYHQCPFLFCSWKRPSSSAGLQRNATLTCVGGFKGREIRLCWCWFQGRVHDGEHCVWASLSQLICYCTLLMAWGKQMAVNTQHSHQGSKGRLDSRSRHSCCWWSLFKQLKFFYFYFSYFKKYSTCLLGLVVFCL